jgi:hypothetical protein
VLGQIGAIGGAMTEKPDAAREIPLKNIKSLSERFDKIGIDALQHNRQIVLTSRVANGAGILAIMSFIGTILARNIDVSLWSTIPLWLFSCGLISTGAYDYYLKEEYFVRYHKMRNQIFHLINKMSQETTLDDANKALNDKELIEANATYKIEFPISERYFLYVPSILFVAGLVSGIITIMILLP